MRHKTTAHAFLWTNNSCVELSGTTKISLCFYQHWRDDTENYNPSYWKYFKDRACKDFFRSTCSIPWLLMIWRLQLQLTIDAMFYNQLSLDIAKYIAIFPLNIFQQLILGQAYCHDFVPNINRNLVCFVSQWVDWQAIYCCIPCSIVLTYTYEQYSHFEMFCYCISWAKDLCIFQYIFVGYWYLTLGVTCIDKIYSIFDGFYEACQGQTIIVGYYRRFYILC